MSAGSAAAAAVTAASAASAATPLASSPPSFAPLLAVLLLVLALVPVALWLLKRLTPAAPAGAAGLKLVATLPLGPRDRVIIVEAGDRWWLLGLSVTGITRLGTLPKGELPPAASGPAGFATLLARARGQAGSG